MMEPVLRRTTRRHLNGTVEVVEELSIGGMLSEPLSQTRWADLFGISRNKAVPTLRALGAVTVGEGNARRWRLPLSEVPLRYFGGRIPSLHKFVRHPADSAAGDGTISA